MTVTLLSIAVLAFLIGAYDFIRRVRSRRDIASSAELQKQFGLYAENRQTLTLNPADVPANLRHLVPLAEKWGIGDDIIRNDFIEKSSEAAKRELHDAMYEPFEQVTEWLNSFAGSSLPPEGEAFMYMQTALDEMGYYILEEKRAAARESNE